MKDRGVLIAIFLILILGIGTTSQIHRFVAANTESASATMTATSAETYVAGGADAGNTAGMADTGNTAGMAAMSRKVLETGIGIAESMVSEEGSSGPAAEEEKAAGGYTMISGNSDVPDGAAPAEAALAVEEAAKEQAVYETAAEEMAEYEAVQENAPAAVAVTSGEEAPAVGPSITNTVSNTETGIVLEEVQTAESFQKKLEEVERIVEEMRDSEASSNTDSMKRIADQEYRLWDAELNRIYQAIMDLISEKEAEPLREEERQWIRERDQLAKQTSGKFKGGTMESLEYTASLAAATKERAYELLETYGYLFPQDE